MTTPFWCLLVATLMPFVLSSLAGYFNLFEKALLKREETDIDGREHRGGVGNVVPGTLSKLRRIEGLEVAPLPIGLEDG